MKTKDWGAFFLLAIGIAAVWFWASGKAAAVWGAISATNNSANPTSSTNTVTNGGSANTQTYTPPNSQNPLGPMGQGISIPLGYASPNASQSPLTSLLQSSSPKLLTGQQSLSTGFNLSQFIPPTFVPGYANVPMYNEQTVPFGGSGSSAGTSGIPSTVVWA